MSDDPRHTPPAAADAGKSAPAIETPIDAIGAAPLGAKVGNSMAWMLVSSVGIKLMSFAAQIALGWLLLKDDFGYYALATSLISFFGVFRTGGARDLLIQGGARRYDELAGPLFWYAIAADTLAGLLLMVIALPAAVVYNAPVVAWMLLIQGVCTPLGTPAVMLSAKLLADLRNREFMIVFFALSVMRYGGSVVFALLDCGAMSFFYPLPLAILAEFIVARRFVGDSPWRRPAHVRRWHGFLDQGRWIIFTTFAGAFFTHGENMIIGVFVSPAVLGVFFFAHALVKQAGAMLAWNLHQVLFPALSHMEGQLERQRQAMLRALSAMSLATSLFMGVQAVTYSALERLLWGAKWEATVLPMIVAAVLYPMRMMLTVAEAACYARIRFRLLGTAYVALGVCTISAAAVSAKVSGDPLVMTIVSGLVTAAMCLALNLFILKVFEIPRRRTLLATLPAWLGTGAVAAAVVIGDHRLTRALEPIIAPDAEPWALRALDVARIGATAAVFSAAMLLVSRAIFPRELHELLRIVPRGRGKRLAAWLRLSD